MLANRIPPALGFLLLLLTAPSGAGEDLDWARENYYAGRYADAAGRLENILADGDDAAKASARRLLARVRIIAGKHDDAAKLMTGLAEPAAEDLNLLGEALAARGRYTEAQAAFEKAFETSKQSSVAARINLIELYERTGQKEMAELSRNWFFQTYQKAGANRYTREGKDVSDAAELLCLGRAMEKRDPQGAINAYTCAQKSEPREVEPFVRSYFLFTGRFAWGEAGKELERAQKINKRHPSVQLAAAYQAWARQDDAAAAEKALKEALSVNPNMSEARCLAATLHLFDDEFAEARAEIDAALAVNPADPEALALLAAWHFDQGQTAEYEAACRKALEVNPKYAGLYLEVAGICERKRQFPAAEKLYAQAVALDPDDWQGYYGLGMSLARRGQDAEGKKLLEKAFELNKFNLFCRNMLVVLDKLVPREGDEPQFESLKTEHFTVLVPRDEAAFLLPYYGRLLEEAYARMSARYGLVPEGPLVVETFSKHNDFSARTAGLPGIGADGACFGKLITLDTPRVWLDKTIPQFNWATVAEHELMHVFSLQLTDFRIPRWLTEGLSVYEESAPRLELDRMFVTAVANNALIKVSDMNRQMSRPTVPTNGLLAYYQAGRICDYIVTKHGPEGMKRLLSEVRAGRKLEEALKSALGCTMAEFEAGVLEHQKAFAAANIRQTAQVDQTLITKLLVEVQAHPEDPAALAALASAYASPEMRRFDAAKKRAEEALKSAKEADGKAAGRAHAVLGVIAFEKDKNYRQSREHFERAVAVDADNFAARLYLGRIANLEGDWKGAVEQLERARAVYPRWATGTTNPYDELSRSYEGLGDKDKALEVLRARVAMDKFAMEPALKLARQALAAGKPDLAEWACWQAVKVDPFKAEPHLLWGRAAEKARNHSDAEREYRLAARAEATGLDSRLGLARVLWAAGKKDEARQAVAEARAIDAEMPEVVELVKSIGLPDAAAPAPAPAQERPGSGDKPAGRKPEERKPEEKPAPPGPEPKEVPKLEKVRE